MKETQSTGVSIVIPTYNRADFLRNAIESALAQTYKCEVIVCNHGSTDHTDKVVAEFGDKVIYIKRDKDLGPHFCWLEGVISASGVFVHLQFDDDWIKPTYIESCMEIMTDETGFVFSATELYDDNTQLVSKVLFSNWLPRTGVYSRSRLERKLSRKLVSPAAIVYRKQDLIDALYQGKLPLSRDHYHGVGPDCWATLLCLLRYTKFGYVKEPLAVFRSHEASITISAIDNRATKIKLQNAYREVRRFYREQKFLKMWRAFSDLFPRI